MIHKERHIYYFACVGCGRPKAWSFKRSKAKKGICRKCHAQQINPDQIALFPVGNSMPSEVQ